MNRDTERYKLLDEGIKLMHRFCAVNTIKPPKVVVRPERRADFAVCAYYRDGTIHIWPLACAAIGRAGRQWSYPGYVIDRTPYGVVAHELAHYVDDAHGPLGGRYGVAWRKGTRATPLTGYCPNSNEWFAELFRLYVTNPDLLRWVRPYVYSLMHAEWQPATSRDWKWILRNAPRQRAAAQNKIHQAQRAAGLGALKLSVR